MSVFGKARFGLARWSGHYTDRMAVVLMLILVFVLVSFFLWAADTPEPAAETFTLTTDEAHYLKVSNQRLQNALIARDSFVVFLVGKYKIPQGYTFDGVDAFVKDTP